jgi:hypothetical protein
MRLVTLAVLAATPAVFAQRGAVRSIAAPVRVRPVGPASRTAPAPAPAAPRPGTSAVAPGLAGAPVVFLGYYPNPLYYGPGGAGYVDPSAAGYAAGYPNGYANGYVPQNPGPAGDYGGGNYGTGPAPAYYGADPSGQGYPTVLVNPNYAPDTANPVMRDYSYLPATGDAAPAPQPNPTASVIFLIAMKDHTIYPAIAYWVEDNTLNYITEQGVRNRVSLGLVDRDFSVQLNKERVLELRKP